VEYKKNPIEIEDQVSMSYYPFLRRRKLHRASVPGKPFQPEGFPGTNALAYSVLSLVTKQKKVHNIACKCHKAFFFVWQNKPKFLSLNNHFHPLELSASDAKIWSVLLE
jgi:hypothetical protein